MQLHQSQASSSFPNTCFLLLYIHRTSKVAQQPIFGLSWWRTSPREALEEAREVSRRKREAAPGSVGLQLLEGAIPSKSLYSKGQGIRWSRLATHSIKTARQLHTVGLYILLAEKGLDEWNHLHFLLDEPATGEITDIDECILLQKMQEPYVLRGAKYMKSWKLTLQINRRTYSSLSALLKSPIPRKQGLDYPRTIKLHVSSSIPVKPEQLAHFKHQCSSYFRLWMDHQYTCSHYFI